MHKNQEALYNNFILSSRIHSQFTFFKNIGFCFYFAKLFFTCTLFSLHYCKKKKKYRLKYLGNIASSTIDIPLTAFIIIAENETIEELDLSWNFFRRGSTLKLCEGISVNIFLTIEFKNSNSMNSNTKVALS